MPQPPGVYEVGFAEFWACPGTVAQATAALRLCRGGGHPPGDPLDARPLTDAELDDLFVAVTPGNQGTRAHRSLRACRDALSPTEAAHPVCLAVLRGMTMGLADQAS